MGLVAMFGGCSSCSSGPVRGERYAKQTLLLTYFAPLEPGNGQAEAVVNHLAKKLGKDLEGMRVETCAVPREEDRGAGAALACAEKFKPNFVIGFSEGDCHLRLETAADNKDSAGELIDPAADPRVGFTLPVHKFYCQVGKAERDYLIASTKIADPAANNFAFHLAERLVNAQFAFVQVPGANCAVQERDAERNAGILARLAQEMFLREGLSLWRAQAMPTSLAEVVGMRAAVPKDSCEAQFLDQLEANYQLAEAPLRAVKKPKTISKKITPAN